MAFCENCGVQESRGKVIPMLREHGKTLCAWCITDVPESNRICRPPTRAEFEAQFVRRDGEEFKTLRRLWDAVTKPPAHVIDGAAAYLRQLAAWDFPDRPSTVQWFRQMADAIDPPKPVSPTPAPPAAPAETCAECGKALALGAEKIFVLVEGGKVHTACAGAWQFHTRGDRVKARLKVGDAVRMADDPQPITPSGRELERVLPKDLPPLSLAGKVGTVRWVCRQKPAVGVHFPDEEWDWECHCGNFTRLVPDPEFKE